MVAQGDGGAERRVLLLPPTSKDGEVTRSLLSNAGLNCVVCQSLRQLVSELNTGAAAIVLTEEAIQTAEIGRAPRRVGAATLMVRFADRPA